MVLFEENVIRNFLNNHKVKIIRTKWVVIRRERNKGT
jgi:hypothetical protein